MSAQLFRVAVKAKTITRFVVAAAMVAAGIFHFLNPEPLVRIVPTWLLVPVFAAMNVPQSKNSA